MDQVIFILKRIKMTNQGEKLSTDDESVKSNIYW